MGICMGAFAKRPYKHNSKKVIDYQFYRLCQSFGTLTKFMKFMMQKRFLDFSDSLQSAKASIY